MSSFVMSATARAAPARLGRKAVGGLGFRQAVAAVRVPVQPKAPVAQRAVAMVTFAGKPGQKAKTKKAAAKRFKITASGKVLHRRPGKQHLNGHKTTERKNRLSKERQIGKSQLPLIKGCLPYQKKYLR